ncbi:MAG: hypothetical protein PGN25_10360 [Methylorubrum populi]
MFAPRPGPVLDASVRPLVRGAALAAVLAAAAGLPTVRPLMAGFLPAFERPEVTRASRIATARKETARVASLREAVR